MTTPTPDAICERLRRSVTDTTAFCPSPVYRNPDGPEAADLIQQQRATIERLSAEKVELRRIIAELGYCTPDASLDFMAFIPAEVRAALGKDASDVRAREEDRG